MQKKITAQTVIEYVYINPETFSPMILIGALD